MQGGSNFCVSGWSPTVRPFKWKLLSSTFLWYCSVLTSAFLDEVLKCEHTYESHREVHLLWYCLFCCGWFWLWWLWMTFLSASVLPTINAAERQIQYLNFRCNCRSENMTSSRKSLSSLSSTDGSSLSVFSFSHGHCNVLRRCSARIWERSWALKAWL